MIPAMSDGYQLTGGLAEGGWTVTNPHGVVVFGPSYSLGAVSRWLKDHGITLGTS